MAKIQVRFVESLTTPAAPASFYPSCYAYALITSVRSLLESASRDSRNIIKNSDGESITRHSVASPRSPNKTSKRTSKFTHTCMAAFVAMEFKAKNPPSWEFIMDQPISNSSIYIINPDTNQPYDMIICLDSKIISFLHLLN